MEINATPKLLPFILSKLETNNERLGLMPQKTFILKSRNQNEKQA
jgi:hypothetical protein